MLEAAGQPQRITLLKNSPPKAIDAEFKVTRLAFGSCASQNKPQQNIWEAVLDYQPELFLLLGDNIYGDTENMDVLRAKYETFGEKIGYQNLIRQCPVISTWDDHDYGINDGGFNYPKKSESQEIFLNFFGEPEDSERRNTPGIHTSYLLGPEDKRVQIIMLDARYWRTPLKGTGKPEGKGMGDYEKLYDPDATMLGHDQWLWLEEQFKVPAKVRLIGMSTQFIAAFNGYEAWINIPAERDRMFDLIKKTKAEGVIFLSGDTHWAELSLEERAGVYPLYDLTSSGLTNVWNALGPNQFRVGPGRLEQNFGAVEINWAGENTSIALSIKNPAGETSIEHTIKLRELKFSGENLEPSEANFTGRWNTDFGEMTINAEKETVKGTIVDGRTIAGIISGRRIIGGWADPDGTSGHVEFNLTRDGKFLQGSWAPQDKDQLIYSWSCWR